ncbi:MAG TPA: hypothetical protein PLG87_12240, partial [Treponemataceae bacterium]|nr:hypothetical protein [Treponemataceae bacterium]
LFLIRLRKVWSHRDCIRLSHRKKNMEAMARLELKMDDIKTMCFQLKPDEKIAGPCEDDKGRPGEIWIFHHSYKGTLMYLKFSLEIIDNNDLVIIISCHEEGLL